MNKKGFTLMELIAVIVILAITLLIAVPKVINIINNSKKNTFLSSIEMFQEIIKTNSLIFKSNSYILDSNGVLKRIDGDNEVQVDYKGILYSKDEAVISVGSDNAITLVSGEICDSTKKYCIGSGSVCNISSTSIELLTINDINEYSAESYDDVLDEGDITKANTSGSVTYKYCSNGTVVIDGNGDGLMKGETYLFDNLLKEYFMEQVSQKTGISLSDINKSSETILYYVSGYTKISDFSEWGIGPAEIFWNIVDNNENYTSNLNTFIGAYDSLDITFPRITKVIVNSGVKSISDFAFCINEDYNYWSAGLYSVSIDEIYLSNTVQTIGQFAFGHPAFESTPELTEGYNNVNTLVIPNSVSSIGQSAFSGCGISSLTLGTGLTEIPYFAFSQNKIENLTIPSNVTEIERSAFYNNKIESIVFNSGIVAIRENAFKSNNLISVTIPSSIQWIGDYAFYDNNILQNSAIIQRANNGNLVGNYVFNNNGANRNETITPVFQP